MWGAEQAGLGLRAGAARLGGAGAAGGGRAAISRRRARRGEVSRRPATSPAVSATPVRLPSSRTRLSRTITGDPRLRNGSKPKGRRYWHLNAL